MVPHWNSWGRRSTESTPHISAFCLDDILTPAISLGSTIVRKAPPQVKEASVLGEKQTATLGEQDGRKSDRVLGKESAEIKGRLKQDCAGSPTQSFLDQSSQDPNLWGERPTTFRTTRDDSLQAFPAR